MQFFRLLHRQTKSEGDVSTLLYQSGSAGVIAPVFVPLQGSLPSFDPGHELYASPVNSVQNPTLPEPTYKLNAKIIELETQLALLQDERTTLEQDLTDYRTDLLQTRSELYSEMLRSARHQQCAVDDFRTIQKLEARHQRFCTLLVDIGIPRSTVDVICQIIQSGNGSPDDILVNAIKDASKDDSTLLARLRPIITDERTPEHYQSALNLTLSIRKELKSQKKRSRFWKKLAQENDRHAGTVTPSPSDISSIRQDLSPGRQRAVDALIARRRESKYTENAEGDVFGGRRRESALESLASSLASRPRRSIQDDLRLSSSFSSASSASTHLSYLSGLSRIPKDPTTETPTVPPSLPSTLSTSLRRSSRGSSQSVVLGSINLNVSRSSSIDPTLLEETEQNAEADPASMVTLSQDLLQNVRRASQGHGHRRMPSTTSRRSAPTHSNRSSFRLSTFSPFQVCQPTGPPTDPNSNMSTNNAINESSIHTPNIMLRLSDLTTNIDADTPAPSETTHSEDTPFNDTCVLPKYGVAPFSLTELGTRVSSTPSDSDGSVAFKTLYEHPCTRDTRFLEHLDSCMSMTTSASTSVSVSASETSAHARDGHDHGHKDEHARERECDDNHRHTNENRDTMPLGESNDSLFTASASASVTSSITANDTPAPTTPPTPSSSPTLGATPPTGTGARAGFGSVKRSMLPVLAKHLRRLSFSPTSSPERERLVSKLRGLRSLSQSRSRSRSKSKSPSGSASRSRSRSVSGSELSASPLSGTGIGMWHGSPARSESSRSGHLTASSTPSPSPVKESAIPVLQRRMTIRARGASMRKV